jgi:hypothetical protein
MKIGEKTIETDATAEKTNEAEPAAEKKEKSKKELLSEEIQNAFKKLVEMRVAATKKVLADNKQENGTVALDDLEITTEELSTLETGLESASTEPFLQFDLEKDLNSHRNSKGEIPEEDLDEIVQYLEKNTKDLADENFIKKQIKEEILEKRTHKEIRDSQKEIDEDLKKLVSKLDADRAATFNEGDWEKAVILKDVWREILFISESVEKLPIGLGRDSAEGKNKKITEFKEFLEKTIPDIAEIIKKIKSGKKEDEAENVEQFNEIAGSLKAKLREISG